MLLVEDVVDTGLTLAFLTRTLAERGPASIAAVTLLDRPYRRLVENIGLRYVGFTVPDELFAGYGLGLEERWRALPDLRYVPAEALAGRRDRRRVGVSGRPGSTRLQIAERIDGAPLTRTSKWTCGPVECPVLPESAITKPVADRGALPDEQARVVGVGGREAVAVVDHDEVPVARHPAGVDDRARGGRVDRGARCRPRCRSPRASVPSASRSRS